MSLSQRLDRLRGDSTAVATPPCSVADRLQRIGRIRHREKLSRTADEHKLANELGGELLQPGLILLREQVEDLALVTAPQLPGRTGDSPWLYLDTETTGLSGGSGTLAFLVGVAWRQSGGLLLEQFLITRFAGEQAMLAAVHERLSDAGTLVSYNGKSFDLPLLQTRLMLQRHPIPSLDHLDLLHPVRRLFSSRWPDCRLETAEKRLLGVMRKNDLPGSEAPAAWFDWMHRGASTRLGQVIRHNRQDIISLPLLHDRLSQMVCDPGHHGEDCEAMARWIGNQRPGRALELLLAHQGELSDRGLRELARRLMQSGRDHQALDLFEQLARSGCMESRERLAKYHEHVSRRLELALAHCQQLFPGQQRNQREERLLRKLTGRSCHQRPLPLVPTPPIEKHGCSTT